MTEVLDLPLPPITSEFQLERPECIMKETPDSYQPIPGHEDVRIRTLPIGKLSNGAIGVVAIKQTGGPGKPPSPWHYHNWDHQLAYITKGWGLFEFEGLGIVKVEAGTFLYQLPRVRHREIEVSEDFEGIEITLPAKTDTFGFIPDPQSGQWSTFDFGAQILGDHE